MKHGLFLIALLALAIVPAAAATDTTFVCIPSVPGNTTWACWGNDSYYGSSGFAFAGADFGFGYGYGVGAFAEVQCPTPLLTTTFRSTAASYWGAAANVEIYAGNTQLVWSYVNANVINGILDADYGYDSEAVTESGCHNPEAHIEVY